jgi:hypothetical protein
VTGDDLAVVHPDTGERIDNLDAQPPEKLAELYLVVDARLTALKEAKQLLTRQLRRRVDIKTGGMNRVAVFGDFEVQDHPAMRREWDADELEGVLRDLIDQGVIHAGEVTDVIRHKTEVTGTVAASLERRLVGSALEALKGCRKWVKKPGVLQVARSVQLPTPEEMSRR